MLQYPLMSTSLSWRAEFGLLLATALYPLSSIDSQQPKPDFDWHAFLALVARHNVTPGVYLNLSRYARHEVPAVILDELKRRYRQNSFRALTLTGELIRLARLFERETLPLWPLKGPALSQHLFGDFSLRSAGDLDILVPRAAIAAGEALLLSAGYQRQAPAAPLSPRQAQVYFARYHHFGYLHPEKKIAIELHWSAILPALLPPAAGETLLSRSRSSPINGVALQFFAPEDLLIYLALHGAMHNWARLKWLIDFAACLCSDPPLAWEVVSERAHSFGVERPVAQGVLLAQRLLKLPVPEPLRPVIAADPVISRLADSAVHTLLQAQDDFAVHGLRNGLSRVTYLLNLKKDWRYQWAQLTTPLIEPQDWADQPLPDVLFPLYYGLRPFLWLRRYYGRRRA